MLADPLGLTLAETAENPVQVGYSMGGFSGSVFAFNEDTQRMVKATILISSVQTWLTALKFQVHLLIWG